MLKSGLPGLLRKTFGIEEKLHPLDRRIAKRWVKLRLVKVFPELRDNPEALERAYQSLTIEPRIGTEEGDAGTYYQILSEVIPSEVESRAERDGRGR